MNLQELKITIDKTMGRLREKPEKIPVLITLAEKSICVRAFCNVAFAGLGFDWERGQFRIEPEKKLVTLGESIGDAKAIACKPFDGRSYYFCPRCESRITKKDYYCRYCGQKLRD